MKALTHGLALASLIGLGTAVVAQIERFDLPQMLAKADNCVLGTITEKRVIRVDHPVDGPELYYTILTLDGRSLKDNTPVSVDVTFPGGMIDATHGVFNSEAPSADDIQLGNRVVAFYKHSENMGGDVSGNALMCSHGGLFRTFERKGEVLVQGRGDGYAIATNVKLGDLSAQVQALSKKR